MTAHAVGFWIGLVFGAVGVGFLCGLVPALAGAITKQKRLAYIGFVSCLISGAIAGVLLAGPVALGFAIAITVKWFRRIESTDSSSP